MKKPIFGVVAIAIAAVVAAPASAAVPASAGRLPAQSADPVTAVHMTRHETMMMKHHKRHMRPAMHKHHMRPHMMHTKPMMKHM